MLPGFDKTAHHIDNVIVTVVDPEELKAVAKSNILAYHFIKDAADGESWTLMGNYEHGLERPNKESGWKITKMALNVDQQFGNLKLLI